MDKFLVELLKINGSVILPDFGTLSVVDEESGELMFNEYLKFNDGKLIAHLCENSTMDEQEAKNTLAKYIRDIQQVLDKGDTYDIFGIGKFKKDSDGSINFIGSLKGNKTESEVILGPSPTPNSDSHSVSVSDSHSVSDSDSDSDSDSESSETTSEDSNSATSIQEEKISTPKKPASSIKRKEKVKPEPKPKKKRGVFFYILAFILLIVAAGGIYIGLNYDEVKAQFGWDKFKKDDAVAEVITPEADNEQEIIEEPIDEEIVADEIIEEEEEEEVQAVIVETPIEKPAPKPTVTPTVSSDVSGTPFHVIGGSFGDRNNAENFVNELKSKGYRSHIVGEFNGMHMVSVQSFADRSEAVAFIPTVQNDAPKAWLFKHPK
jgi:cell division septation protein DedD